MCFFFPPKFKDAPNVSLVLYTSSNVGPSAAVSGMDLCNLL